MNGTRTDWTDRSVGLGALCAYAAAAVWMTWPLATAPARLGLRNMDVFGNIWALAWSCHQALHDPLHLFDSNMFYPWSGSLAYAESLLPQALQAAPVRLLGGSPLLAYNVVFLLTFVLSAFGAYLLAREISGSRRAGLLAGLAFGFCAYRWDHIVHLQSLSTQWLPLALWFALRSMRTSSLFSLIGLGACALLQILSSGYYAMLLLLALGITLLWEWRAAGFRRAPLVRAVVALGVASIFALPVFLQHRALQSRHGYSRSRDEVIGWSAHPRSYIEPGNFVELPHLVALHRLARDGEPLFPGSWALVFGAIGLVGSWRDPRGRLPAAWLLVGFALSLGPVVNTWGTSWPGPFELFRYLPGGALLRTPARLGVLALLGLAVLAACAWARVVAPRRARHALFGLAVVAMLLEARPAEFEASVRPMPRPPASALWLAQAAPGVVLELPWNEPAESALYLYWSTAHWQPMVNGFGSFDPPDNFVLGRLGNRWPSDYSAEVLRGRRIRYVVVHLDLVKPGHRRRLEAAQQLPRGVALLASLDEARIYGIDPNGPQAPLYDAPAHDAAPAARGLTAEIGLR